MIKKCSSNKKFNGLNPLGVMVGNLKTTYKLGIHTPIGDGREVSKDEYNLCLLF